MSYNTIRKQPEMFDNPVILNLHYFKRDSYISVICQAADFAAEDRKADAVTHLAPARSQNTGNGILGYTKEKRQPLRWLLFKIVQYIRALGF